jgi:alpha-glucosidase (family GH31 glycosyl hydrolase)
MRFLVSSLVFLGISPLALSSTCDVAVDDRQDCGINDSNDCVAAGCCWEEHTDDNDGKVPWCFASGSEGGYSLDDGYVLSDAGLVGTLSAIDPSSSSYGDDIVSLALNISFGSEDNIRILITDNNDQSRWQVPESIVPSSVSSTSVSSDESNLALAFTESPFSFTINRKEDGAVLFASSTNLVFKDQYLELSTSLDSTSSLFGLGDITRSSGLAISPGTISTMWARDMPALAFDLNLYGSHPMYMNLAADGNAHGAFLRSSNGMDAVYGSDGSSLTFKVIGGVIDLFVFNGPSPAQVAAQYTNLIGRPSLMPYWSLGYHQCRYGYPNLQAVEDVKNNFTAFQLPLDILWMDIDYMEAWKDWTYDGVNFPQDKVLDFVNEVHDDGQKFVIIVDPGILAVDPSWDLDYPPYTEGIQQDLFIRDGFNNEPYISQVWPGPTHFPDFFHPNTSAYWSDSIETFYNQVPFDGLWTDMNEVSNFCNDGGQGQVCTNTDPDNCPTGVLDTQTTCCLSCSVVDSSNQYDFPPYAINNDGSNQALGHKTLPPSAMHYLEDSNGWDLKEYDVHNLYGLLEARVTAKSLSELRDARPFVLSRSTFPSHGTHAAHWQGDNAATWADLKASSIAVMNFNMYGIPMIGSDMCGFNDDTTEELCGRWMALGSFHPFSRNHNAIGDMDQEPYRWDSVADVTRSSLGLRYRLLPYLYTLFFDANQMGDLPARPLWVSFPEDANTHGIDEQFMLGDNILVSPALYEGVDTVNAYFPVRDGSTVWYALGDGLVTGGRISNTGSGASFDLDTPISSYNVHLRSGAILPLHGGYDADDNAPLTTTAARLLPYELIVALDFNAEAPTASGHMFFDDGNQVEIEKYMTAQFAADQTSVTSTVTKSSYDDGSIWGAVTVVGLSSCPDATVTTSEGTFDVATVITNSDKMTCTFEIGSLEVALTTGFSLSWDSA